MRPTKTPFDSQSCLLFKTHGYSTTSGIEHRIFPRTLTCRNLSHPSSLDTPAKQRQRPRDLAIFLILRYTGMRRESVATLTLQHLEGTWGLRGVWVKGGTTRDIPLPAAVMEFLHAYVERGLVKDLGTVHPPTPPCSGPPGGDGRWGRRGPR